MLLNLRDFDRVFIALIPLLLVGGPLAVAQNFEAYLAEPGQTPVRLEGLSSIQVEDFTIDIREITTGVDVEYRQYAPGTPHFGDVTLRAPIEVPAGKALYDWFESYRTGKNIRKNITVRLFRSDKSVARIYDFYDTTIEEFRSVQPLNCKECVEEIELRCAVRGLSIASPDEAQPGNKPGVHTILSDDQTGAAVSGGFFTSWKGGEPMLHLEGPLAGAKFRTVSPGHKSVGEVTLRGNMTDGRKAMCEWITAVANHRDSRRNLTITEIQSADTRRPPKKYNYYDGFPVRYSFPSMSVTNTTGNVEEDVRLKFIRMEMK